MDNNTWCEWLRQQSAEAQIFGKTLLFEEKAQLILVEVQADLGLCYCIP